MSVGHSSSKFRRHIENGYSGIELHFLKNVMGSKHSLAKLLRVRMRLLLLIVARRDNGHAAARVGAAVRLVPAGRAKQFARRCGVRRLLVPAAH